MPADLREVRGLERLEDAAVLGPVGEEDDRAGHRLARLAHVARLAQRGLQHLHRDGDPVADRGARLGLE